MIEYIDELSKYLPLNCDYVEDDQADNENYTAYINYLRETCNENIGNQKYQFALLAFHMMFMSIVFRQFWCLKERDYEKVNVFVIGIIILRRYARLLICQF